MRRQLAAALFAGILFFGPTASAHRIDEYLQATILSLGADRVEFSMRLVPGVLVAPTVIAGIDSNADGMFSPGEQRAYSRHVLEQLSIAIDGTIVMPRLTSFSFPEPSQMRGGVGEIRLEYAADLPPGGRYRSLTLTNHDLAGTSVYLVNALVPRDDGIRILTQTRNERQSLYRVDYEQAAAVISGTVSPWAKVRAGLNGVQFSGLFHLGMRHIAGGTDHLLFLLVLLLPAPLLVSRSRWGAPAAARQSLLRILAIVSAFTIGHSITLTWAVLGAVSVPGRAVEVLIALSILVSALHALRPLFAGKEPVIAASFGLIHGLAFASTLDRLGLGRWERITGILAFNLGIEAMQVLVVAAVLPSLMLMSRTRVYPVFRIGGAVLAGAASMGWILERLFRIATPVDTIVNSLAQHSLMLAGILLLVSFACRLLLAPREQHTVAAGPERSLPIRA